MPFRMLLSTLLRRLIHFDLSFIIRNHSYIPMAHERLLFLGGCDLPRDTLVFITHTKHPFGNYRAWVGVLAILCTIVYMLAYYGAFEGSRFDNLAMSVGIVSSIFASIMLCLFFWSMAYDILRYCLLSLYLHRVRSTRFQAKDPSNSESLCHSKSLEGHAHNRVCMMHILNRRLPDRVLAIAIADSRHNVAFIFSVGVTMCAVSLRCLEYSKLWPVITIVVFTLIVLGISICFVLRDCVIILRRANKGCCLACGYSEMEHSSNINRRCIECGYYIPLYFTSYRDIWRAHD